MSRAKRRSRASDRAEYAVGDFARIDTGRPDRTGVPEVILAEGKRVDHLVGILRGLAADGRGALVSRPTPEQSHELATLRLPGSRLTELAGGRVVRLSGPLGTRLGRGVAAVVAAGTSDVPCAEEARVVLEELGVTVLRAYDVGVAGLHRLLGALERLERARPKVYLVFAGREGALPTVVAGLVRAPVVGVPTSVGYGRGSGGGAALDAMLQSCAPLAVVNIDAAVPAALFASHLFVPARRRRSKRR